MSKANSTETAGPRDGSGSLHVVIYKYFFYGWLFQDASIGSDLERAAALRHNRYSAKWLPTYLWRWSVVGTMVFVMEIWAERSLENAVMSAVIGVGLVCVIVFLAVSALSWALLRGSRSGVRRTRPPGALVLDLSRSHSRVSRCLPRGRAGRSNPPRFLASLPKRVSASS